jgi:hypothetical protein
MVIKNRRIWIDFVSLNYRRKCTTEVYKNIIDYLIEEKISI